MEKNLLSIGEASRFLSVSVDTLRRWDLSGKLRSLRSEGGHRYYNLDQLETFKRDFFVIARIWAESEQIPPLSDEQHCETQDVFRARLDRMAIQLDSDSDSTELAPLLTAVTGEIGNNSFDHNIGNWPDVPGIFFAYDLSKRIIVLADRGLGIRATLSRVRPELDDDVKALTVAFKERVSGRAPEQRGNGLKFVCSVATIHPLGVSLQSGMSAANIAKNHGTLKIGLADSYVRGTLTMITY